MHYCSLQHVCGVPSSPEKHCQPSCQYTSHTFYFILILFHFCDCSEFCVFDELQGRQINIIWKDIWSGICHEQIQSCIYFTHLLLYFDIISFLWLQWILCIRWTSRQTNKHYMKRHLKRHMPRTNSKLHYDPEVHWKWLGLDVLSFVQLAYFSCVRPTWLVLKKNKILIIIL